MISKRVTSCSAVLFRMEKCEAALGEHVIDTGREVPDITIANCWRRLVSMTLFANLQKMSRIVLYSDAKRYIVDQVGLGMCHDPRRPKLEHKGPGTMDTSLAEIHYNEESGAPQDNEDPELNAFEVKSKRLQGPMPSLRTVRPQAVRMPQEGCGHDEGHRKEQRFSAKERTTATATTVR